MEVASIIVTPFALSLPCFKGGKLNTARMRNVQVNRWITITKLRFPQNFHTQTYKWPLCAQMDLHPQGEFPVVKEFAFNLAPGFETSVAVQQTVVSAVLTTNPILQILALRLNRSFDTFYESQRQFSLLLFDTDAILFSKNCICICSTFFAI